MPTPAAAAQRDAQAWPPALPHGPSEPQPAAYRCPRARRPRASNMRARRAGDARQPERARKPLPTREELALRARLRARLAPRQPSPRVRTCGTCAHGLCIAALLATTALAACMHTASAPAATQSVTWTRASAGFQNARLAPASVEIKPSGHHEGCALLTARCEPSTAACATP